MTSPPTPSAPQLWAQPPSGGASRGTAGTSGLCRTSMTPWSTVPGCCSTAGLATRQAIPPGMLPFQLLPLAMSAPVSPLPEAPPASAALSDIVVHMAHSALAVLIYFVFWTLILLCRGPAGTTICKTFRKGTLQAVVSQWGDLILRPGFWDHTFINWLGEAPACQPRLQIEGAGNPICANLPDGSKTSLMASLPAKKRDLALHRCRASG